MFIKPRIEKEYFDSKHKSVLYAIMYPDVVSWLNYKIAGFLIDYMCIKSASDEFAIRGLTDYSYLITPAFKALEGTLLEIGKELKLNIQKYKHKVGALFNEEDLEKYYNEVLEKIEHITEENKIDIKQWLDNAKRILKSLRHTPAHYEGEVKENLTKAFLSGDLIISTINEMCHVLIQNRLFPSILKKEAEAKKMGGGGVIPFIEGSSR